MTSSERNLQRYSLAVMLALLFLSLSTCGRDNPMRSSGAADVVVAPAKAVLTAPGRTVRLTATVRDQSGQSLTNTDVRWSSGNPSVATVDQSGLVTARQPGTAILTAASGSAAGQATVTVEPLKPKTVAVTPATATLTAPGQTVRLTATARDQAGQSLTNTDVRWSSGSPSMATVDQSGLVTARQAGTAVITVTAGSAAGQATVTVAVSARRAMSIAPRTTTLKYWKQTVQLTVTAYDRNGKPVEAPSIVWSSGNENVATVDESGLVTAGQTGTTWITADLGGSTLQAKVTVLQPVKVDRIYLVITGGAKMMPGDTRRIDPVAVSTDNVELHRPAPTFTWSSDNPSVATVDENGIVTAHAVGTARITAAEGYGAGEAKATETIYVFKDYRAILIALYRATDGPNWTNNDGWLTDAPLSEWHGVSVDEFGRVVGLYLQHNNMSGSVPAAVGDLSELEVLTLEFNALVGPLPQSLTSLGSLSFLDVFGTELCAPANAAFQAWLRGVESRRIGDCDKSDQETLVILYRATDGPNWTNNDGWLTDKPLSEWYGVTVDESGSVTRLDLSNNNLSGSVPAAVGDLSELAAVNLGYNALSGPLPQSLTGLGGLQVLHAEGSALCAPMNAAFRAWLREIGDRRVPDCENRDREPLIALYRATDGPNWTNNDGWLTDAPLSEWHGVSVDEFGRVVGLYLQHNNMSGSVPAAVGDLSELEVLTLEFNALVGPLPQSLTSLGSLSFLDVFGTELCAPANAAFQAWLRGVESRRIGDCDKRDQETLVILYRATDGPNWTNHDGWLTDAPLSEWYGVTVDESGSVTRLDLSNNNLSGSVPAAVGDLSELAAMNLGYNALSGPLPQSLTGLGGLQVLHAEGSALCAPMNAAFRAWLREIGDRRVPDCENRDREPLVALYRATDGPNWTNNDGWLTDAPLSEWYGVTVDEDRRVTGLSLSNNRLSGPVPADELNRLDQLRHVDFHFNLLNGSIPASIGYHNNLQHLDLSTNRLSGPIPSEFVFLNKLRNLKLGDNALSGPLPQSLTGLGGLRLLHAEATALCAPTNDAFQAWLRKIGDRRVTDCEHGDREALVALYRATDGPNWTNQAGWLTDAPLSNWHGVIVDEAGRVTGLNLRANRLSGPVPADELNRLDQLRHVNFQFNLLNGSIPTAIDDLDQIQGLNLSANRLSGPIPSELGFLDQLKSLDLGSNGLSGPIPPELGRLNQLQSLDLIQNRLTGSLPPELGRLANLTYLALYDNDLSGPIPPELGLLNRLESLKLGKNGLSGSIPTELSDLEQLRHLELHDNPLTGYVPLTLVRLRYLSTLYLNGTQTCILPDAHFNAWLQGLPNKRLPGRCENTDREALVAFHAATNGPGWTNADGWLSGAPLNEWHGVSTDEAGRVTKLALAGNRLSGPIPAELAMLAQLSTLDLGGNELSGPVPSELGNHLEMLRVLDLGGNDLSGPVPPELSGLGALRVLDLSGNALSGPAPPELGGLGALRELDLGGNSLSGSMPRSWSRLSRLEVLRLESAGVCVLPDEAFRSWLQGISDSRVDFCEDPDREVLVAFYHAMNGPGWKYASGWLSDAPLEKWQGVTTDGSGRVTVLEFRNENLSGRIPSNLGSLDMLRRLLLNRDNSVDQALSGPIPPELGNLSNLQELNISKLDLTGEIPSELGNLHNLELLQLYRNKLSGPIPPELGNLSNLKELYIVYNYHMSGSIPPELGNLRNLRRLSIYDSNLSGQIPKELGNLTSLEFLSLSSNQLTGPIPMELGNMSSLEDLYLIENQLTGPIPKELGNISSLERLYLSENQLTSPIPMELGNMSSLERLHLSENQLTGPIPPELGNLSQLRYLDLSQNNLTGSIPKELAGLWFLLELALNDNAAMSGPLPPDLRRLSNLRLLGTSGTDLCAAPDGDFLSWLQQLESTTVVRCTPITKPRAYLTQAVQTLDQSVPLLADERALLRVFVTAGDGSGADFPPVRATFFHDGVQAHVADVPGRATAMPAEIDEGSLSSSINAEVPAWVIRPGLQMAIEIGPEGGADSAAGEGSRLPETGAMTVEVIDLPPFNLTVVPILNMDHPDRSILNKTARLTEGDDLFRMTQDLLPISGFSLNVRDFVWTSEPIDDYFSGARTLLREIGLLRAADGSDDYYLGVIPAGGRAATGRRYVVSGLREETIAHELGHAMSLRHAPCGDPVRGDPANPDPWYPYTDGTIGTWGYNFRTDSLVSPETFDLMGYCTPDWISGYHFTKALRYRKTTETTDVPIGSAASALLLWGGVDENGALVLEPAFVADDATWTPPERGPYRLTGTDNRERVLFTVDFGMDEFAHVEGGAFAFALPARSSWAGRLARITLTGPQGGVSMDSAGERTAALLRDRITGQVRGLLRDMPTASEIQDGVAARVLPPEPGLEMVISRGVPEKASW